MWTCGPAKTWSAGAPASSRPWATCCTLPYPPHPASLPPRLPGIAGSCSLVDLTSPAVSLPQSQLTTQVVVTDLLLSTDADLSGIFVVAAVAGGGGDGGGGSGGGAGCGGDGGGGAAAGADVVNGVEHTRIH